MTTKHDALEEYKKAIRVKFEVEKGKEYSSFLIVPSRAQLRRLCVERFKNNTKTDDLKSFELFLGFEFSAGNKNKLQSVTDKFRPIENFLKGETDLSDPTAINMAAILVDFNPRPFNKFNKSEIGSVDEVVEELPIQEEESRVPLSNRTLKAPEKPRTNLGKSNFRKKISISILVVICVFLVGYNSKKMFFSDNCMQWNGDHYQEVTCDSDKKGIGNFAEITPYDKELFELKKIAVCDTTTFFRGAKVLVWYCKVDGNLEYFTSNGFHPVTGKALKPISNYIIKKYVKPSK